MSDADERKLKAELLLELSEAEQALNLLHELRQRYSEDLFAAAKALQHLSTHPKYFSVADLRSIPVYPERDQIQQFATEIGEAFQRVEVLRERKAKLGIV